MSSFDPTPSTRAKVRKALSRGERVSQARLAERFDRTKRQIRNVIADLREEGVEVRETFENRERVYYLPPEEWHADTVTLDLPERQLLALLLATRAAAPTLAPTPLEASLEAATEALETTLGPKVVSFIPAFVSEQWDFGRAASAPIDADVFWSLREAVDESFTVSFDYYTASTNHARTKRKMDPLMFGVRKGAWLCAAYCHRNEEVRDFNLVDVENVEILHGRHFQSPAQFDSDTHFSGRFGAIEGDATYTVSLRVEASLGRYFRRKVYHPTQQITLREDGDLDVRYRVKGMHEIASFVRSWGVGVEVLEPMALRKRIAEEAKQVAAQYDS